MNILRSQSFSAAAALLSAVWAGSAFSQASSPELRGTWITTTGYSTGHVKDAATTNLTMQRLANAGLNTVYIDTWRNGYTQFPSSTLGSVISANKDPALGSRDLLAEVSLQGRRQGLTTIGWFQYGLAAGFGAPSTANPFSIYARDQGWLLTDVSGNYVNGSNNFAWMNPLIPEVRTFMKNMILESVRNYDLDGIQFDDRLAWPVQFGFNASVKQQYVSETGNPSPVDHTDANFLLWRSQKVTDFGKEVFAAVKAERPSLIVSVSPAIYPFSYTNYAADWPAWANTTVNVNGQNTPLFDEIIPQVYRSTSSAFSSEWASEINSMPASRRGDLAAGISINNSSGAPYNWNTVNLPQVNDVRNDPVAGHVWWFSTGVLDTNEANITALYGGTASHHPDQAATWRIPAFDAVQLNSTTWQATVPANYVANGATYTPAYRVGNVWTALSNVTLLPGQSANITVPSNAVEVELMIDRRFAEVPSQVMVADFETSEGYFANSPTLSGSNFGVASASADRVTAAQSKPVQAGTASQELVISKAVDAPNGEYFLRHLAGIGTPGDFASNLSFSSVGAVSLWLRTTTPDVRVSLAVDDTTTGDRGYWQNVIPDGTWRQYFWYLDDASQWDAWVAGSGDGSVGPTFSIDSVQFLGGPASGSTTTLHMDSILYDPAAAIPNQLNPAGAGNVTWQTAGNWIGTVPNAIDATARLMRRAETNTTVTLSSNITLGTMTLDNNAASYTISGQQIAMDVTSGSARVNVINRGSHTIASNLRFNDTTVFEIDRGSTLNISGTLSTTSPRDIQKTGDGVLNISGPLSLASSTRLLVNGGVVNLSSPSNTNNVALTVQSGTLNVISQSLSFGSVTLSGGLLDMAGNNQTLRATTLTLTSGVLAMNDADLIVNYSAGSPLAALVAALGDGRLTHSADLAGVPTRLVLFEASALSLTAFNGFAVDATTAIGKFTYAGDTNLDGLVDSFDYSVIDDSFGQSGGGFLSGDLNDDGVVDSFDYSLIDDTFGAGQGQLVSANTEVFIPEPVGVGPLGLLLVGMARRRR